MQDLSTPQPFIVEDKDKVRASETIATRIFLTAQFDTSN